MTRGELVVKLATEGADEKEKKWGIRRDQPVLVCCSGEAGDAKVKAVVTQNGVVYLELEACE